MTQQPSLFSRSLQMFAARAGWYLLVAAIPYAALLAVFYVFLEIVRWPLDISPGTDPVTLWNSLTWGAKFAVMTAIPLIMWAPFYLAGRGLCRIASDQHLGRPSSAGALLGDMAAFTPVAFVCALLVGFASFIGMAALLVPAVVVPAAFTMVVPTGVVEQVGPLAAIGRSFPLYRRVVGRTLLVFLVYGLFFVLAFILKAVLTPAPPVSTTVVYLSLGMLFAFLLAPIALFNICLTLLCYEAREKNQPALAPAMAGAGVAGPGPVGNTSAAEGA